ncbi:hypothetical protein HZA33_04565 [Candidatus Pacearchaeota archaeon]|nr:hypothetical protein [Candidatus Pacearchaeota archaeon]
MNNRKNNKATLTDLVDNEAVKSQKGNVGVAMVLGIAAMPVGAYLGSWIGEGVGYVWGHVADFVPYLNHLAPWLAERCGDLGHGLSRHALNTEFYQVSGAVSGFMSGLFFPFRLIAAAYSKD